MSKYGFAISLSEEGFGQSRQNLREQYSWGRGCVKDFSCSWLIKLSSVLIFEECLIYPLGSCDLETPGVGREGRSRENPKPNHKFQVVHNFFSLTSLFWWLSCEWKSCRNELGSPSSPRACPSPAWLWLQHCTDPTSEPTSHKKDRYWSRILWRVTERNQPSCVHNGEFSKSTQRRPPCLCPRCNWSWNVKCRQHDLLPRWILESPT